MFFDLEKIFKFRVPYQHMQFVQSACNQALRYRTRRIEKLILDEYISQWYTEFATQFNNKYLVQYVFLFLGKNACSALHTWIRCLVKLCGAIWAMRFSVCGFGCAPFYFIGGKNEHRYRLPFALSENSRIAHTKSTVTKWNGKNIKHQRFIFAENRTRTDACANGMFCFITSTQSVRHKIFRYVQSGWLKRVTFHPRPSKVGFCQKNRTATRAVPTDFT